jgi:PAS domain-containing protein
MGDVAGAPGTELDITHGICPDCVSNLKFQTGTDLKSLLDTLAIPVLVVNRAGVVEAANQEAEALLQKNGSEIEGRRQGDVFECAYARLPEGCGQTTCCSGCAIRQSVQATYATGRSLHRVPAYLKNGVPAPVGRIHMHISTEKVGEVVLLRIDDIETDAGA